MVTRGSIVDHIMNCYRLTVKLLHHIRKGSFKWFIMFIRLLLFTIILIPAWYTLLRELFARHYASLILFDIPYTSASSTNRNLLDIYLPNNYYNINDKTKKYPVIIFVSGGAWIIGYKLWSFIIAMPLAKLGCIVIVPDYRNFPQGNIDDMMNDIYHVLQWTHNNIATAYRGDGNQIVLAGQSAGAHITLCVLVEEFKKSLLKQQPNKSSSSHIIEALTSPQIITSTFLPASMNDGIYCEKSSRINTNPGNDGNCNNVNQIDQNVYFEINSITSECCSNNNNNHNNSDVNNTINNNKNDNNHNNIINNEQCLLDMVCMYVGISGPYDLITLCSHMHKRGLDSTIFNGIFHHDLFKYSPTRKLQQLMMNSEDSNNESGVEEKNDDRWMNKQKEIELSLQMMEITGNGGTLPIAAILATTPEILLPTPLPAQDDSSSPLTTTSACTAKKTNVTDDDDDDDDGNNAWYDSKCHTNTYDSNHRNNDNNHSDDDNDSDIDSTHFDQSNIHNSKNNTHNYHNYTAAITATSTSNIFQNFPPVYLYHGLCDATIPHHICTDLGHVLSTGGGCVRVTLIPHWSHTDGILEAPLQGDDSLLIDIIKQLNNLSTDYKQESRTRARSTTATSRKKRWRGREGEGRDIEPIKDNLLSKQSLPPRQLHHHRHNTAVSGWIIENLAENEPLNKINTHDDDESKNYENKTTPTNNNNNNNITRAIPNRSPSSSSSTSSSLSSLFLPRSHAILCIGIHHPPSQIRDSRGFSYLRAAHIMLVQIAKLFNPF